MRKWTRRMLAWGLAMGVASGLTACDGPSPTSPRPSTAPTIRASMHAGRTQGPRPFRGSVTGVAMPGEACSATPPGILVTATGEGAVTHLGTVVLVQTACVSVPDFLPLVPSLVSLSAADGDRLDGTVTALEFRAGGFERITIHDGWESWGMASAVAPIGRPGPRGTSVRVRGVRGEGRRADEEPTQDHAAVAGMRYGGGHCCRGRPPERGPPPLWRRSQSWSASSPSGQAFTSPCVSWSSSSCLPPPRPPSPSGRTPPPRVARVPPPDPSPPSRWETCCRAATG